MKSYLISFVLLIFGLTCHAQSNEIITYKYRGAIWFETMVTIPATWEKRVVSSYACYFCVIAP